MKYRFFATMGLISRRFTKEKALIHLLALIVFVAISALYSKLIFVETNSIYVENQDLAKISNANSTWTEQQYSGCPTVSHGQIGNSNVFSKVIQSTANLGHFAPFCLMLSMFLGFYIFLNSLKISQIASLVGSLSFGLFCYGIGEIQAGEYTEMTAVCLIPFVLTGTVCIFNDKKAIGAAIALISIALLTATCHYQILYYTIFTAIVLIAVELLASDKNIGGKLLPTAITIAVFAVAFLTNSESSFQEYEYSKYAQERLPDYSTDTIRFNDNGESLSLLIPQIKGGKSASKLSDKSETYNLLEPLFKSKNAEIICNDSPMYFGKKHFSNGTSYIGIIAILLALIGCIRSKKRIKWWAISTTIIAIILSCGNIEHFIVKNLPLFYNYSIFSNILIISAIGISVLAAIGTEELIEKREVKDERKDMISLYISTATISVILLIFVIFPSIAGDKSIDSNNFTEVEISEKLALYMPQDIEYAEAVAQFKDDYINAIRSDRVSLIRRDAAKSLLFLLLGATAIFFGRKKKINRLVIAATLSALIIADITITNWQQKAHQPTNEPTNQPNVADTDIEKDHSTFRVMDIRNSKALNDKTTYLKYNSISGSNGYCPKRYKTFCDSILNTEIAMARYNILSWAQRDNASQNEIQDVFSSTYKTPLLDMLNIKYIILSPNTIPLKNTHACGNAWFADSIRWSNSEQHELIQIKHINTHETAIVNEKYKAEFTNINFEIDSTDYIKLIANDGNNIKYESSCNGNRLAIFSEMFYPKGWKVKIDGQKASFFRANYILRAMIVPQGKHIIEFCYEPQSAKIGATTSIASSIVLAIILIISAILQTITTIKRKKNIQNEEA